MSAIDYSKAYITHNNGTSLATIDSGNSFEDLGAFVDSEGNALSKVYGLAFGKDGEIYLTQQYGGSNETLGGSDTQIWKANLPAVGGEITLTKIGTGLGVYGEDPVNTHAMDIGPDGSMYILDLLGNIFTVDLSTGLANFVAETAINGADPSNATIGNSMDIVFDANSTLYAQGTHPAGGSKLFTINASTGAATSVGAFDSGTNIMGLWTNSENTIYATKYFNPGNLYTVNPETAALTLVGSAGDYGDRPHGGDFFIAYAGWPVNTGGGSGRIVIVDNTPIDPAPAGTNFQLTDSDGDGIREVVISADGTSVDGNRDGIPDAQQSQVAGLRLINDGSQGSDFGALSVADGVQLQAVTLTAPTADGSIPVASRGGDTVVTTIPNGINNAFAGVLSFNAAGVSPGGTTQATITFPTGMPAGSGTAYLRFNYDNNRFEEFLDDTGNPLYTFVDSDGDGNIDAVNLVLTDGDSRWDGDDVANGVVVDPGFLAVGQRNIVGTNSKDAITGNMLDNTIKGKKSNDWIFGDLGKDLLIGGKGRDHYVYVNAKESTRIHPDKVRVGKEDRFYFKSFDADTLTEGQQSLRYIGDKGFSGSAGELRYTGSGLKADTTGDGIADFFVSFTKATPWFSEANISI